MDCHDRTTVDICSEPECLASTVVLKKRKDLTAPHTPNHSMLKVHRILFSRDTGRAEKNAKDALEVARGVLSDLKTRGEPMPPCAHCKKTVSQPCWYCVDCTSKFLSLGSIIQIGSPTNTAPAEERFNCDDCEYKCLAFNEIHTKKHTLVRVIEKVVETVASTEERLRAVEEQLESVQAKMEELLSKFLGNSTENSPVEAITKRDVQVVVEGTKNTGSDNRETNNQEATTTASADSDQATDP